LMAPISTELALHPVEQSQLAKGKQQKLADLALSALGLLPQDGSSPDSEGDRNPEKPIAEMRQVMRQRGVKQRFADGFDLKIGDGQDVPENESEPEFLNRVILTLKTAEKKDIIKALDRVEKNNRKAVSKDADFKAQQLQARAKDAAAAAGIQAEDVELGSWYKGSIEDFAEEFQSWVGDKDFSAFAGADVSYGNFCGEGEDSLDATKIKQALDYFHANMETTWSSSSDANAIRAELANWQPAQVISAYRKLSLTKHPDKKGGSSDAFEELTSHAAAFLEALGYSKSKRGSRKQTAHPPRRGGGKTAALCVEVPDFLKTAMAFFDLSEEDFKGGAAEIKGLRLRLGTLKGEKEKQIQRERDLHSELLSSFAVELGEKADLKQIRAACISTCRKHYTDLYTHLQKIK